MFDTFIINLFFNGDVYPITIGGRIFTFVMLMVGLGIVAIPTGLIASALTKVIREGDEG